MADAQSPLWVCWDPVACQGRSSGLAPILAAVFKQEESRYDVPANFFQVGVDMVGPTLIEHASADMKESLPLRQTRRAFLVSAVQRTGHGFGLRRACRPVLIETAMNTWSLVRRSGPPQRIWLLMQSCSHETDWSVPKHRGISFFVLDMASPGITVRPLRQIDGAAHFSEVFLDEVRIPATNLVGAEGAGWGVALTTLNNGTAQPLAAAEWCSSASCERWPRPMGRLNDPRFDSGSLSSWLISRSPGSLGMGTRDVLGARGSPGR